MAKALAIVGEVLATLVPIAFALGLPVVVLLVVRAYQIRRVCRTFRFFRDPRARIYQFICWKRDKIDYDGFRYYFTAQAAAVFCWVEQLANARIDAFASLEPPIRLVSFRPEFRTIIKLATNWDHIGGLVRCLKVDCDEMRRIAIMLLGRSRFSRLVARFKSDPDPAVRRVVARALRRLTCFDELCSLADDVDPRVRRLASSSSKPSPRSYSERLGWFVQRAGGVVSDRAYASSMPLYLAAPVGEGKPPKTRGFVRRILEHIRQLVRANPRDRIV